MDWLSGDPRMALQADSRGKEDRKYPHWNTKTSPKKGDARFRLLFLAFHAILEAQQAEKPRTRVRV